MEKVFAPVNNNLFTGTFFLLSFLDIWVCLYFRLGKDGGGEYGKYKSTQYGWSYWQNSFIDASKAYSHNPCQLLTGKVPVNNPDDFF